MSELDSDIKRPSSLLDSKFRTEKGCPDELAQLPQLLWSADTLAVAPGTAPR